MRFDALYEFCSSLPHATLSVQWGDHDVFKVGGKMFAILTQDIDVGFRLSLKADPEEFDELCGEHGVRPAPYMARNQWVQVVADNSLGHERLRSLVARSHGLVLEKLPAKQRRALDGDHAAAGEAASRGRSPRPSASGGAKRAATGEVEVAKKRTTTKRASPEKRTTTKGAGTTGRTTTKRAEATERTMTSASAKKRTAAGARTGVVAKKRTAAGASASAGAKKRTAAGASASAGAKKRTAAGARTGVVAKKRTAASGGAEKRTTSKVAGPAKQTAQGKTVALAKRAARGKAVTAKARGKAAGAAKRARG